MIARPAIPSSDDMYAAIDEAFRSLLDGPLRATLFARQAALDFTRNKARVVRLMLDLLGDIKD